MALNQVTTINPSNSSIPDGGTSTALAGKQGEQIVTELHGKWYTQAYRGNVFIGSTALAGTVIPINAASLVSTFTLWNPLGSGKNLELISYDLGIAGTTTAVIGSIGLVFQAAVGAAIVIPTSQTALTPINAVIGLGNAPVAKLLSAGTLTGTPSVLGSLGISFGTTGATPGPATAHYEFDGKMIVPPGVLITTVSTAAQTQAMQQQFIWAEVPV